MRKLDRKSDIQSTTVHEIVGCMCNEEISYSLQNNTTKMPGPSSGQNRSDLTRFKTSVLFDLVLDRRLIRRANDLLALFVGLFRWLRAVRVVIHQR